MSKRAQQAPGSSWAPSVKPASVLVQPCGTPARPCSPCAHVPQPANPRARHSRRGFLREAARWEYRQPAQETEQVYSRRGFLESALRGAIGMKGLDAALRAGVAGAFLSGLEARAACTPGSGNPIECIPSVSTPYSWFLPKDPLPPHNVVYKFTGGDGNVNTNEAVISATDMMGAVSSLLFYQLNTDTAGEISLYPSKIVDISSQVSSVAGVAIAPNGRYVIADASNNNLRIGTINGTQWQTEQTIVVNGFGSQIKDIDVAPYLCAKTGGLDYMILIATQADGIRRVDDKTTGATSLMYNAGTATAVEVMEFRKDTYNNPLLMFGNGNNLGFKTINLSGVPTPDVQGDPKACEPNNDSWMYGIAFFNGGLLIVEAEGAAIHKKSPNWNLIDYMRVINLPGTQNPADLNSDCVVNSADVDIHLEKKSGASVPHDQSELAQRADLV